MLTPSPLIVVVGSINVDLTFRAPHLPRPGETVLGRSLVQGHGGKGANQAVMAAKLGARVAMVGRVGADAFGDAALANLQSYDIDTTHVRRDPERPTGVAAIVVDDAGENSIVVAPGANAGVSGEDVRSAADLIRSAAVVVAQLEVPVETVAEAFRIARGADRVLLMLNLAPSVAGAEPLFDLTDVCVLNESELEGIAAEDCAKQWRIETAVELLRETRFESGELYVTCGGRGTYHHDGDWSEWRPAPSVPVVESTGAGDAFVGALAFALTRPAEVDALDFAQAAAALSVTRPGIQAAYPDRSEVEEFLKGRR